MRPRLLNHGVNVCLDGLLVERVDVRRLGHSACGGDFLSHSVDRCQSYDARGTRGFLLSRRFACRGVT